LKEKALKRSEEDDLRELKGIIIQKFSEARIKGFEDRDQLLQCLSNPEANLKTESENVESNSKDAMALESSSKNLALDERTFLSYRERQFELLDKLLGSNFFL
jgi:hypothetical protein